MIDLTYLFYNGKFSNDIYLGMNIRQFKKVNKGLTRYNEVHGDHNEFTNFYDKNIRFSFYYDKLWMIEFQFLSVKTNFLLNNYAIHQNTHLDVIRDILIEMNIDFEEKVTADDQIDFFLFNNIQISFNLDNMFLEKIFCFDWQYVS